MLRVYYECYNTIFVSSKESGINGIFFDEIVEYKSNKLTSRIFKDITQYVFLELHHNPETQTIIVTIENENSFKELKFSRGVFDKKCVWLKTEYHFDIFRRTQFIK